MQTSMVRGCQGLKPLGARRSAARAPAFSSTTSRRSSVQVFAKGKGKGKSAFRQGSMPGQMEMIRQEPPVPEVDPVNAEFVVFCRALKYKDPTVNAEVGPSLWFPVTILKGNQALNFVSTAVQSPWGNKLYGRTLIWQIGTGIYKDKVEVEKSVKKIAPMFAKVPFKDFELAFKCRDKANPKDWLKPEGLTILPPESELGVVGVDQLKKFFSMENLATMFKAPEEQAGTSSAPAQQP